MALLAQLTKHLGKQNELIATDALGLLLTNANAAAMLASHLAAYAPALPTPLRFTVQTVGDDATRPDLIGSFGTREVVHIEGKFWAGLTPAQPTGYLSRLQAQTKADSAPTFAGLLLFVCPVARVSGLFSTVCTLAEAIPRPASGAWHAADTSTGQTLMVTDWHTILTLLAAVETAAVQEDVRQLQGLIDDLSETSYRPWSVEELTEQDFPRHVMQLIDICREVRDRLIEQGVATIKGKKSIAAGPGIYGFPVYLDGCWSTPCIDLKLWEVRVVAPSGFTGYTVRAERNGPFRDESWPQLTDGPCPLR